MSRRLPFWKLVGAGNDFVVVDARGGLPLATDELARRLCVPHLAVGADGLIAVTEAAADRVVVDFRNADGSAAGFCGNGARCTARYAVERGLAGARLTVVFPAVEAAAVVGPDEVELTLAHPQRIEERVDFVGPRGRSVAAGRYLAGVEHVVAAEDPAAPEDLPAFARALFAARPDLVGQVNVTLVAAGDPLGVRTFERGVGETLACGSGALAAALFARERGMAGVEAESAGSPARARLRPPAGVVLAVGLDPAQGRATLRGEARVVYVGEAWLED